MKRFSLILLLVLLALLAMACGSPEADSPPPTQLRVLEGSITSDPIQAADSPLQANPTVEALQATIDVLETQQASIDATATRTANQTYYAAVTADEAVLLTEAHASAGVLARIPNGTALLVRRVGLPDAIGVVFMETTYDNQTGWVASTQVTIQSQAETTPVITQPAASSTPLPTATLNTPAPTVTITPTPLPAGFPEPKLYSVDVAEQIFENGRMMWFQPNDQIWVMMGDEGEVDPTSGTWRCVMDTFEDGDLERDDTMDPPMGTVTSSKVSGASIMQPVRGFGKVWRDHADIRERIGWALLPEQLLTTRYEYHFGGEMVDGVYVPAPGEYHITSMFKYDLIFYEMDGVELPCEERHGTWEIRD